MSTRQSEHVIYSSFVVEEYRNYSGDPGQSDTVATSSYRWSLPSSQYLLGVGGFDSEEEAIADAKRTFGMP